MRETKFIEQNKEKWTEFETLLKTKERDPDRLNKLFVEITDDLSYSRTFYPNRSVRYYLNGLAQSLFFSIYKNRRGGKNRLTRFWKEELPQIVWESRREFLLAFLVFMLAFSIGVLSCAMDIEFPRIILGDAYVNMTNENIAKGDPMQVYKNHNEVDMFLGIALNNIIVSFRTFISGILAGIGTIGVLIYNGIMVGAFQYFFIEKGVFVESFLTIWIHGTLEISAIIIAGAAGLVLGRGLVFPGTYNRLQAFQISARRGLKILVGIVPIFIAAAFLEGFLTRYTETPDILRLGIILLSLLFILGYFVWYPRRLAQAGFAKPLEDEKLPPERTGQIDYLRILGVGEIFKEGFSFLMRHLKMIVWAGLLFALLYCVAGYFLMRDGFMDVYVISYVGIGGNIFFIFYAIAEVFRQLVRIFTYDNYTLFFLNTGLFTLSALWAGYLLTQETKGESRNEAINWRELLTFTFRNFISIVLVILLLNAVLLLPGGLGALILFIALPIFCLWLFVTQEEELPFHRSLSRTFYLLGNGWGRMYGVFLITILVVFSAFSLINSGVVWICYEVIQWNFDVDSATTETGASLFTAMITVFTFSIIFPLIIASMGFLYFTLREIKEANGLKERIKGLGQKRRVFGLEMEN